MKQNLIHFKEEIDSSTITTKDFNIQSSIMIEKINRVIKIISQLDVIDIFKTLNPRTETHLFSSVHGPASWTDYFKRLKTYQEAFIPQRNDTRHQ